MLRKTITNILSIMIWYLLTANTIFAYTHQDTLKGSNGMGRNWWNVIYYNLNVDLHPQSKSITGDNEIVFVAADNTHDLIQLDLQSPMILDSAKIEAFESHSTAEFSLKLDWLSFTREGDVYWLSIPDSKHNLVSGSKYKITAYYHGKPVEAKNPPWDGGFIWTKDEKRKDWVSVACQGLGASAWWPCKDYQADEPDSGSSINITYPKGYTLISNGRKTDSYSYKDEFENEDREGAIWEIKNPINTYNLTFYIGDYIHWSDTINGENGILDIDLYALRQNETKAKTQFEVVKQMLHCFEYWMGPYPFYRDGYKLVEAPFLGMEHQSAVAYGNEYKMGYKGKDRSKTGVGLLFDFIIVHESGHEWFGNNITAKDMADNWLHEGFTTYAEALFVECAFGKAKAYEYTTGEWVNILNKSPVIGEYGVRSEGSPDRYDKGSAVVHMVRIMMNDDLKFREMLRGLNKKFYHSTVTSAEIEEYIIQFTGLRLKPFFDQYLRSAMIPELEWYIKDKELNYRFNNVVPGFSLPITIAADKKAENLVVKPGWQSIPWKKGGYNLEVSADFLITTKP